MKMPTRGAFVDHDGQKVPYMLRMDDDVPGLRWVCDIDPHEVDEWHPAGRGRTHSDAIKAAREWWKSFDVPA